MGTRTGRPRGRPKGSPNKSTAEIRELARRYAPAAIKELARLAKQATSEQARVSACSILLDRAYGKSVQPLSGDENNPFKMLIEHLNGRTRGVPSYRPRNRHVGRLCCIPAQ